MGAVTRHDLAELRERFLRGELAGWFRRLVPGREHAVARAWEDTAAPPVHWYDVPRVRERWNRMVTGDPAKDFRTCVSEAFLNASDGLIALSLGCGTGERELAWARTGRFARIAAYDLSAPRITHARAQAAGTEFERILDYRVGDALRASGGPYDVVLAEQSLHHFSPMPEVVRRLKSSLKPGGLLIVDEYVGPDRFQWTDAQLAACNDALSGMPERMRTRWKTGAVKKRVYRPGTLTMRLHDRSEAVESSRILPALRNAFDEVFFKPYGGNLLHPVLNGIAHHFTDKDGAVDTVLTLLFAAEDRFMDAAGTGDFVTGVYRNGD